MISLLPILLAQGVVKVQVVRVDDRWILARGGQPYTIKGVGGTQRLDDLAKIGGNSIRSWGSEKAAAELADAQKRGLTMTVGIWLGHKSYFDYSNEKQVKEQYESVRKQVTAHRNAPALLMWGLGNEMENGNNTAVLWKAVGDLAKLTKSIDPNHPVMTVVAEVNQEKIDFIKQYAPEIDVLGVNSYGGLGSLGDRLKKFGWTKPYVVTEYGTLGPWETGKTAWGAAFEQTSSQKADFFRKNYTESIEKQAVWCLGSYAFLWGWKQEETPTWFGLFLPSGEKTERVDLLEEFWTGRKNPNPVPRIVSWECSVTGKKIAPGSEIKAAVKVDFTTGLTFEWVIQTETPERSRDGVGEAAPRRMAVISTAAGEVMLKAPMEKGKYRVALTIRNRSKGAATANAPFFVE